MIYMNWRDYIVTDPNICHGRPCVKGTRIPVSIVLDNLADGLSLDEVVRSYPSLNREAVQAVVLYAAELARQVENNEASSQHYGMSAC